MVQLKSLKTIFIARGRFLWKGKLERTLLMEESIKRIDFNAILTIVMAYVAMSLHCVGKAIE